MLRSVEPNDNAVAVIDILMSLASMAGPVYDPATRTLSLCSLVRVHSGISQWMNWIISVAALLQIGEARILAPETAKILNAQEAVSGHPKHGVRPEPDEMVEATSTLIAPLGQEPSRWSAAEFDAVVDNYMNRPPALLASGGGPGCTVEFPYGDDSSLCQMAGDRPHPRYGNGLFLLQSFPVVAMSDSDGARLALSLNEAELRRKPFGYGFGSYTHRNETIHFVCFLPNIIYRPGLLPNLYFSCAQRAREMSIRLKKRDWTPESFRPSRSAIGRLMARFRKR